MGKAQGNGQIPEKALSLWARVHLPPHSFQARTELLLERVPWAAADDVLEIGVGPGYNAYCLGPLVRSWVGVDISAELLALLPPARKGDVRFVLADATSHDFARAHRGRFTKVISSDVLQALPDPLAFFRAIGTVLAPDGEAFVTFPNDSRGGRTACAFPSRESLERILDDAGLEAVDVRTVETRATVRWVKQCGIEAPVQVLRAWRSRGRSPRTLGSDDAAHFHDSFFHRVQNVGTIPRLCLNAYMEFLVFGCRTLGGPFHRLHEPSSLDPARLWLRLRRNSSGDRVESS